MKVTDIQAAALGGSCYEKRKLFFSLIAFTDPMTC